MTITIEFNEVRPGVLVTSYHGKSIKPSPLEVKMGKHLAEELPKMLQAFDDKNGGTGAGQFMVREVPVVG